jgi:hypothetical protein
LAIAHGALIDKRAPFARYYVALPASDTLRWKSFNPYCSAPASVSAAAIFNSPVCGR